MTELEDRWAEYKRISAEAETDEWHAIVSWDDALNPLEQEPHGDVNLWTRMTLDEFAAMVKELILSDCGPVSKNVLIRLKRQRK